MKCKKCGADLSENDKICLNCGFVVGSSVNDLYDDINTSDDEDDYVDDSENDSAYNKELDDLLNSYKKDDKKKKKELVEENIVPDYSSFKNINDTKTNHNMNTDYSDNSINNYNNNFNNASISTSNNDSGIDNLSINELVSFTDSSSKNTMNSNSSYDEDEDDYKEKKKLNISIVPFKIVFFIALIVLIIVLCLFGYKYYKSRKSETVDYEINKNDGVSASKYSLTNNPNYISGKTWVCGSSLDDGNLSNDSSTYFQYDFNEDKSYATQYYNKPDTYESGTYSISLEEIGDNTYTYKMTMIARLNDGYKTRYIFTLVTNKEGTKGTYKMNSKVYSCEEMNYHNNK